MRLQIAVAAGIVGLLLAGRSPAQIEPVRSGSEGVQGYKAARASYEKARKHFEKRDLEKAVKELDACLKRMPDFSEAHFLLAKVAYLEKRFPDALAHMERAEATFEKSSTYFAELQGDRTSELERLRDRQDSIIDSIRGELARTSNDEQRRQLQMQLDQAQLERDRIQRELLEPPTAGAAPAAGIPADYHFFHGNILLRLDRLDDAAARYREALKVKPDHADASNNLASLYLDAGYPEVAKEFLDQAEAAGAVVNAELKQAVLAALKK